MADMHFLYGPNNIKLTPPVEWEDIEVTASFNMVVNEANINTNQYTFVDNAAEFIKQWIVDNGVFNGIPFKINVTGLGSQSQVITTTIFDGYIKLDDRNIDSNELPIIYICFVVELNNDPHVLDLASITTHGQLRDNGTIVQSDFIGVPDIQESRLNIRERIVILTKLLYDVVTSIINIIQQIINAIADTVGLSFILGLLELVLAFFNGVLVINQLIDMIKEHKNLFFPNVEYRAGIKLRTAIERGFQYLGYTVEFGIIEEVLSNVGLLSSQNGEDGFPAFIPNASFYSTFIGEGILRTQDFGYTLLEDLEIVDSMFNVDFSVIGTVVHIKTQSDPFWSTAPAYVMPVNIQVEITKQYQNGSFKEKPIDGTFFGEYSTDETDSHTLTVKKDDSIEVRRTSSNILNQQMFTIKGIDNQKIPLALCVRKQPFDNLWDLFTGITAEFDVFIDALKDKVDTYQNQVQTNAGVGAPLNAILDMTGINLILANRTGVLKIENSAFNLPKIVYLTETQIGSNTELRIPDNFKDFIGWEALYNNYHSYKSPATENGFSGQWVEFNDVRIGFSVGDYLATKQDSHFLFNGKNAKFTQIVYNPNGDFAVVSGEFQEVFDDTLIETVIKTE